MHYHLLPMGFNKHPIPPYTVSTYQELFHCMNTAFLVEVDSQTCIGVHLDTACCCLVVLCTPCPYLPPFPILHPAPSSSPAPSPQPHTCHNHFFCCPSFPPTPYFTSCHCLFLPSPSPSLTLPQSSEEACDKIIALFPGIFLCMLSSLLYLHLAFHTPAFLFAIIVNPLSPSCLLQSSDVALSFGQPHGRLPEW